MLNDNRVEKFWRPRFDEMTMQQVMDELQGDLDANTFGCAFLTKLDKRWVAVHPSECIDGAMDWWRIQLFMREDDPDRIFARITDGDVIHAEIVGAVFLDKRPCCGNLNIARQILTAGPKFEKITEESHPEFPRC